MGVAARVAAWERRMGNPPGPFAPVGSDPWTPPEISVVFNDEIHFPGYTITLLNMDQMIDVGQYIAYWNLVRVSPNSDIWPHQIVRSGNFVKQGATGAAAYILEDIEAPFLDSSLGDWIYRLEIYTDSVTHADIYDLEVSIGQLETFVDTSKGQIYLKPVEDFTLSKLAFVSEFKTWKRPGRKLSEDAVLGRANKVVTTDVISGKEGSIKFVVIFDDPAAPEQLDIYDYEETFETGDTILVQPTNWKSAGFKDLFIKITDLSFERITDFDWDFDHDGADFYILVDFITVDRPTTKFGISLKTWQQVLDNNANWGEVLSQHDTWLDVLLNPTT